MTEMKVHAFTIDPLTARPVVILRNEEKGEAVPIWMSSTDAIAIAVQLIGRDLVSRERGDDLLGALLKQAGMSMNSIVIDSFMDGTFSASVLFFDQRGEMAVKVRASEAIIASLKYELPVLVSDEVIAQASSDALIDEEAAKEHEARRFVDLLEGLKPSDFGKYAM